jgi:dTDP-4-amino-4,6-dideoxygalactose transaminase
MAARRLEMNTLSNRTIPFSRPDLTGREEVYVQEALASGKLAGNGPMTKYCQAWLEREIGCAKALLTQSCTSALEMAALLFDVGPGDEVILPSFTFATTASAFAMRGAVPVFVDIRPDTLNLDETLVKQAITPKTRAIAVVHYAGVGCDMKQIMSIASSRGVRVVEDAAQGVLAKVQGGPLGGIAHLGALSFHETKNIVSGEGGALLVNDPEFTERAEIIWEKGTNRSQFLRGQVDKYTWMELGSSFLMSEITAAVLRAQLEGAQDIARRKLRLWNRYYRAFEKLEKAGPVRRPVVPADCAHNGHIFYLLLENRKERDRVLARLNARGIGATFHYIPLHSSPAGEKFGRVAGPMTHTEDLSSRLLRLPLSPMSDEEQGIVIAEVHNAVLANES